jgi:membrane protein
VLLSLEIAATLVLFGAQVIAQYERYERTGSLKPDQAVDGALGGTEPVTGARAGSRRRGGSPRR